MTASRFREVRQNCCLSVAATAKLLRVTERTVQNWEAGRTGIPYAAFKLLRILRGHELAHPAWRGFRVVGDTLWTPERRAFRPDHLSWWSLTCRMADAFRSIMAGRRRGPAAGGSHGLVSTETSQKESGGEAENKGFPNDWGDSSAGALPEQVPVLGVAA